MMKKILYILPTAAALALAAFMLVPADAESNKATAEASANESAGAVYALASVSGGVISDKVIDFSWKDGSKTTSVSSFAKGKVLVLNFWGTWCPPCRKELPDLSAISREMTSNVVVVGVALERVANPVEHVASFVKKNNIPYINAVASQSDEVIGAISKAYGGISAVPTTFIFDKNGKLVDKIVGAASKERFAAGIKKAV